MFKTWLISQKNISKIGDLDIIVKGENFVFYARKQDVVPFKSGQKKYFVLIDGYVLPRLKYASEISYLNPEDLIFHLFQDHGDDWIHLVKGSFTIILASQSKIIIFSDRIGIKKFFYTNKGGKVLISNQLKQLTETDYFYPNPESIAIYMLMHHYIDGLTFVEDIFYSPPAARISLGQNFHMDSYWDCEELLHCEKTVKSSIEFSEIFSEIIKSYYTCLKPQRVALTLTGGLDSRTILSTLLYNGIEPRVFNYGNPFSADVVFAKQVAEQCGLEFQNHHVIPSAQWFGELAGEIVSIGNSLAHPHRAHRLNAIKEERRDNCENQIVFGGYMGGEGLRQLFFDGLSISEFTWKFLNRTRDKDFVLNKYFNNSFFIKSEKLDIGKIKDRLEKQRFFSNNIKKNSFFLSYLVLGGLHHSQDPFLFHHYIKYPVAIYLDIDFLHLLFGSRFHFLYHHTLKNLPPLKRLKSPEFYSRVIVDLAPQIADIPFAKKGFYSARDYVDMKMWQLLLRRALRFCTNQKRYPVNFSLGTWMKEFVADSLNKMIVDDGINNIFNISELKNYFDKTDHKTYEAYWRRYTDPIFIFLCMKEYLD